MTGKDLILICVLAYTSATVTNTRNNHGNFHNDNEIGSAASRICAGEPEGTFIAHENCNQYYQCSQGQAIAMKCPANLLYNSHREWCDWAQNVDCGDRVIPESCESSDNCSEGNNSNENGNGSGSCNCNPDEAPEICATKGSDGTLVAHKNCNQYHICNHGRPVIMNCPGTLLYNPNTEQCDWPENVDCGERVIPDVCDDDDNNNSNEDDDNNGPCNCNPDEAPEVCAADGSDGTLVAHGNCNQYHICNHGRPVIMNCPGTLLYNPYTEQCDWPVNVDCGKRVIPDDCDDDDNNNSNGDEDGNGPCNCNPDEAPEICAADGSDGTLVAHGNCNQFYKCAYGLPVVLNCPGTLLYNPYTKQCDWPENVDCDGRVIPEDSDDEDNNNSNDDGDGNGPCNCNPDEAPEICAADGSDGILVAHGNCNQFYKCLYGLPVALSCPKTLLYNPYTKQCDWRENVDCDGRVNP